MDEKMKKLQILVLLLFLTVTASAAKIDTAAVFSPKMQRDIPVAVVVPDGAEEGLKYPVLYLLHGYGGSHLTWPGICDLRALSERHGMIFVCPDGENSWYWDSPLDPRSQFETFVSQELVDWVDAHYPTLPCREGRAITGLSMGGHGALWVALRHRERFGAAGATAGGVDIRPFPDSWEMQKYFAGWCTLSSHAQPTSPASAPRRKIDHLMGYPRDGWKLLSTGVENVLLSDHLPVFSEVELVR